MSKAIKVSDNTYNRLVDILEKRETFSQAIDRLLEVYKTVSDIKETLGPGHIINRRPPIDARTQTVIDRDGKTRQIINPPLGEGS